MAVTDRINGLLGSVAIKPPCRVSTTANITLSGLQTIDGVTVVAGDRVLVKNQTTATENGIYEADTSAWKRAKDFNGNRDAVQGTTIPVYAGTVNGGMYYQVTNANPITIGTTSLTFDNALASTAGMTSLTQVSGATVQDAVDHYVTPEMFDHLVTGGDWKAAIQACMDDSTRPTKVLSNAYNVSGQIEVAHSDTVVQVLTGCTITLTAAADSLFLAEDKSTVAFVGKGTLDLNGNTQVGIHYRADAGNPSNFVAFGPAIINAAADVTLQYGGITVDSTGGAASGFRAKNVNIFECYFGDNDTHGCLVAYADGVKFQRNTCENSANHGMEAVNCTDVLITHNRNINSGLSAFGVGTNCRFWEIAHNISDGASGDGTYTIEHNCVDGSLHHNIGYNCRTTGINFSFGTPGSAPFDKLQRVRIHHNHMVAQAGVVTYAGANIYSSTGSALGEDISLDNNTFVGFNRGWDAAYLEDGSFKDNKVTDLTGTDPYIALFTLVSKFEFSGLQYGEDIVSSVAPIRIASYSGTDSTRWNIHDIYIVAANTASNSLIEIAGTGDGLVYAIGTGGALHAIDMLGASTCQVGGLYGNYGGTKTNGGTAAAW